MSPYSRKTGRRYAAGSQATWSPGDSRVCCFCGGTLRITVDNLQIHADDLTGEHRSWHVACGRKARLAGVETIPGGAASPGTRATSPPRGPAGRR